MHIDEYEFGRIVINGVSYSSDVIVFSDRVYSNWWRKEGHNLLLNDLEEVIKAKTKVLIVGCGYSGVMKISKEVTDYCKENNIELKATRSSNAVKDYNNLKDQESAILAIHLTC